MKRKSRKLLSLLTAFAITASAFAGLTLTASAEILTTTYDFETEDGVLETTHTSRGTVSIEDSGVGTDDNSSKVMKFEAASNVGNGYGAWQLDFSELTTGKTEVTVEFDSYISAGRGYFSLYDKNVRTTPEGSLVGGSNKTVYSSTGVFFRQGTADGNNYRINGDGAISAFSKWVTTKIDVDIVNKTFDYSITDGNDTILTEATGVAFQDASCAAVTGVEFYTWSTGTYYFDNLKITVDDASSAEPLDIIINYVDENETIIKTETGSGLAGIAYTYMGSTDEFDSDDGQYRYFFNADNSVLSIASPSADNRTITLAYTTKTYTDITVTNSLEGDEIATYSDRVLIGDTYAATGAQKGYKIVNDKYCFIKDEATTSWTVADSSVWDIEFEESDEEYTLFEDFENITEWGVTGSRAGSFGIVNGAMQFTTYNAAATSADYQYTNTKVFDTAITESKEVEISFDYRTGIDYAYNRTSNFSLEDSEGNVIISLFGTGKLSNDDTRAVVTCGIGEKASAASQVVATYTATSGAPMGDKGSDWVSVDLILNFENGTIVGSIGNSNIDTSIAATNLEKIVAQQLYSLAPQWIDNVAIKVADSTDADYDITTTNEGIFAGDDDENDKTTAFFTTVTNNGAEGTITKTNLKVTSESVEKPFEIFDGSMTLENGGAFRIGTIVRGLFDADATATATVE